MRGSWRSSRRRRTTAALSWLSGCLAILATVPGDVAAQELPLKRTLPDPSPGGCVGFPAFEPSEPSESDRQEAGRLAAAATQASVLGDQDGARDFLERAASLNPTDEGIAYELARTLEALGRTTPAVQAYCRFVSLAPESEDASEVRSRVMVLNPPDRARSAQAQLAFARGVDAFDSGRMAEAGRQFTGALTYEPELGLAYYNRALAYAAERRHELAIEDLRRYLDLTPEAADGDLVLERIGTLRNPVAVYSPATALVAGFVIPGFGQFHTDRPVGGLIVLTVAAAGAGVALLYTETQVRCATPAQPCPPNQIIDETTTHPYSVPGIAAAAAVTVGAAIEGFLAARNKNAESVGVAGRPRPAPQQLSVLPPSLGATSDGRVALELVRLRF